MTLGGLFWVRNGIEFDYCFEQSLQALKELCDQVVIVDVGSTDGTAEVLRKYEDEKTMIVYLDKEEWGKQQGRELIAYYQNFALSFLDTDYYILEQPDEIIHEDCFPAIREAIATGGEAFYCTRINLWRDANSYINVEPERQPCSTQVIRIAKTKYKSVGDGESVEAIANPSFIDKIRIYHYGFVRDKNVMKSKVHNMQVNVFRLSEHDPKLDKAEVFDWSLWFNESELSPITEPHPKFIQEWIKTRP